MFTNGSEIRSEVQRFGEKLLIYWGVEITYIKAYEWERFFIFQGVEPFQDAGRVLPLIDSRAADDRGVYFIDDLFTWSGLGNWACGL